MWEIKFKSEPLQERCEREAILQKLGWKICLSKLRHREDPTARFGNLCVPLSCERWPHFRIVGFCIPFLEAACTEVLEWGKEELEM